MPSNGALTDLTITQARVLLQSGALSRDHYVGALRRRATEEQGFGGINLATDRSDSATTRDRLGGVPIVVKDNIDVAGAVTSGGTPALRENVAVEDAPTVARLVSEGAVIVGKTTMHELALGATSNNAVYTVPRNPWDPQRVPGGSSGGTAVAVALGHAPAGLGTDTGGSVRIPAALCGIYGFRPSMDRYPSGGMLSLSPTRDAVGPMARAIEDIILLDSVLSGFAPLLQPPTRLRLGVVTEFLQDLSPDVQDLFDTACRILVDNGVELVSVDISGIIQGARSIAGTIVWGEAEESANDYLRARNGPAFAQVVAQIASDDVRELAERSVGGTDARTLQKALVQRRELQDELAGVVARAGVSTLIYPTVPTTAPLVGEDAVFEHNGRQVPTFAALIRHGDLGGTLGMTGISIPVGLGPRTGLPVGFEVAGPDGSDDDVLASALALSPLIAHQIAPTAVGASSKGSL